MNYNTIVRDETGNAYELGNVLGAGGQGIVCFVKGDPRFAVKYCPQMKEDAGNTDKPQYEVLCDEMVYDKYAAKIHKLMATCSLAELQHIASPVALLKRPYCGYVMRLMEGLAPMTDALQNLENMISLSGKNGSLKKKLTVLKKLAEILLRLHGKGLVYCDLSPNNIFISKRAQDNEVWLIDSDNIVYENKIKRSIGTPGYRAPEIALGKPNSIKSDIYSFALIAFEYLTGNQPFEANDYDSDDDWDDWDDNDLTESEKGDTQYVYEFGNDAKGRLPLDFVCTRTMQTLFLRTFNANGRNKPSGRPSALEWVTALEAACNSVCTCECEYPHDFLADDCAWCKHLNKPTENICVYKLTAAYIPQEQKGCWDETDKGDDDKCFIKSKYFSCERNRTVKKEIDIPITCLFPENVKCDFSSVKIVIAKDLSVKIEDCRFESKYDGKPLQVTQLVAGTVICHCGNERLPTQLVLERVK